LRGGGHFCRLYVCRPAPMPTTSTEERTFLNELDKKLWNAADRLRANLDAAVYKHAVLGLVFLKYVSDSFAVRQKEIETQLRDPQSEYFLDPADYGGKGAPSMPKPSGRNSRSATTTSRRASFGCPPSPGGRRCRIAPSSRRGRRSRSSTGRRAPTRSPPPAGSSRFGGVKDGTGRPKCGPRFAECLAIQYQFSNN